MKLYEIIELTRTDNQLDEVSFKQVVAGGAFALGTLMSTSLPPERPSTPTPTVADRASIDIAILTNAILKKYHHVSPALATKIATLAKQNERTSFPRAADILAIAGIESSFIPTAISGLKKDPAVGLMQVRPKVWELDANALKGNMELQIKTGADILSKYYKLLGNVDDAVHAYNVGIGNFRRGKHNIDYVHKYKNERQLYKT